MSTSTTYSYQDTGLDVSSATALLIDVTACNDACIALSESRSNYAVNTYEIAIGSWTNTKSVIRLEPLGSIMDSATLNVLDCSTPKSFWISWRNGEIRSGQGHNVGENILCSYTHASPYNIRYVSVSTGWSATGQWVIYDREWNYFLLC